MLKLRVKEVAADQKMSMHQLSLRAQVSYHIIREIFSNPYKVITTDTLTRIAEALNVSARDLIEHEPRPDRQEAQIS